MCSNPVIGDQCAVQITHYREPNCTECNGCYCNLIGLQNALGLRL